MVAQFGSGFVSVGERVEWYYREQNVFEIRIPNMGQIMIAENLLHM